MKPLKNPIFSGLLALIASGKANMFQTAGRNLPFQYDRFKSDVIQTKLRKGRKFKRP